MWPHVIMEFLHWLNVEYWSVSWPNVFAPSVWTLFGILIADLHNIRQMRKMHVGHNKALTDLHGRFDEMSARLGALIGGNDDK